MMTRLLNWFHRTPATPALAPARSVPLMAEPVWPEAEEARLYELVKMKVEQAEKTGSLGDDKRAYVQSAVKRVYREKNWTIPATRRINLAIEVALSEVHP